MILLIKENYYSNYRIIFYVMTKNKNAGLRELSPVILYDGNLVSITTTTINNDEQAEIPEEIVTYTLTKEYENSTLKMSKEYTLDSDSSETRTIYDDYSRVVQEITQEDYKSDLDGLKNDTASDTYLDISAHGQIGRGATIPQHIFLSPKNKSLFKQADTVQGYMWSNSSRNGLIYVKGSVTRILEAQRDTYEYLNEFIRLIGGKHKLK